MGVFATTNRRLTATGTIRFTPDLRAAVEVDFSMTNAWIIQNYEVATKITDQNNLKYTNYTLNGINNPTVSENFTGPNNGVIKYQNLRFNPGAATVAEADVVLTFKITNHSAKAEAMRVTFSSTTGTGKLLEGPTGNNMYYEITSGMIGKVANIEKNTSTNIIITLKVANLTQTYSPLNFDFNFTFDFQ